MAELRFLIDQNVQMGVARWLIARGYGVFHVRMLLAPDSPDPLIAFIANREGLMVVTHDSDFRNITDLLPLGSGRDSEPPLAASYRA